MVPDPDVRIDEDAVSPVIGVILMVAITVVLAAVVFILVSDLGSTEGTAPNISFLIDDPKDSLGVTKASPNVYWNDFTFRLATVLPADHAMCYSLHVTATVTDGGASADACTTADAVDAQAGELTTAAINIDDGATALEGNALRVEAGDLIDFCVTNKTDTTPGSVSGTTQPVVRVIITHIVSNQVVFDDTFASVGVCGQ